MRTVSTDGLPTFPGLQITAIEIKTLSRDEIKVTYELDGTTEMKRLLKLLVGRIENYGKYKKLYERDLVVHVIHSSRTMEMTATEFTIILMSLFAQELETIAEKQAAANSGKTATPSRRDVSPTPVRQRHRQRIRV
jgi:hypothetical protein